MCVIFVQRFEPRGGHFTNFRYYYYWLLMWRCVCIPTNVCLVFLLQISVHCCCFSLEVCYCFDITCWHVIILIIVSLITYVICTVLSKERFLSRHNKVFWQDHIRMVPTWLTEHFALALAKSNVLARYNIYNTIQCITKCQCYYTGKVLWCQVHSSHTHTNQNLTNHITTANIGVKSIDKQILEKSSRN